MKIGLIGAGRWGKNIIDTISKMKNISISRVATLSKISGPDINSQLIYTTNWREICEDKHIDAIVVASPPSTHMEIASLAIKNGIPVLVEKPFTMSYTDALKLRNLSVINNNLCMVDYTHLYSESYIELKNYVKKNKIISLESIGLSNGPFRKDVPVLWDWGSHEIAFCVDILGKKFEVSEFNRNSLNQKEINSANYFLSLNYGELGNAKCTFGNMGISKIRILKIKCEELIFVYNGSEGSLDVLSKNNDLLFSTKEKIRPLERVIDSFVNCIKSGSCNHSSLDIACDVTEVIENLSSFSFN